MSPTGDDLKWLKDGLCRSHETSAFFPETGDNSAAKRAKTICKGCPVQIECLTYALKEREVFGVWGGCTPRQRTKIRRLIGVKNISITTVKEFLSAKQI